MCLYEEDEDCKIKKKERSMSMRGERRRRRKNSVFSKFVFAPIVFCYVVIVYG